MFTIILILIQNTINFYSFLSDYPQEQEYPVSPISSINIPESPIKSSLYAELNDDSQKTRSVVVAAASSNVSLISFNGSISKVAANQKKIRHRKIGTSSESKQTDRRNIKMVNSETQTGIEISPSQTIKSKENTLHEKNSLTNLIISQNESQKDKRPKYFVSDEQLIYDYMNSNEQTRR